MWECWATFTFYGFQIWDWVHCLIIDLIYRMMHEGCGPMLLLQWVVTNDLIYIWYIGLPPAIRCVWLLGSKIRWTDLFWLESRELCWQIAALREDSHWHYNIDIVVTPGDMGVRRQGRVMLTPASVIEININSELTGTLLFAEATPGSRAGRHRGPGGQFAMPLVSLGHKKYYIGLFFKVSKSPITEAAKKWNSGPICVTTLSENNCQIYIRQIGLKPNSFVGTMGSTWPASMQRRSRQDWRITSTVSVSRGVRHISW